MAKFRQYIRIIFLYSYCICLDVLIAMFFVFLLVFLGSAESEAADCQNIRDEVQDSRFASWFSLFTLNSPPRHQCMRDVDRMPAPSLLTHFTRMLEVSIVGEVSRRSSEWVGVFLFFFFFHVSGCRRSDMNLERKVTRLYTERALRTFIPGQGFYSVFQ